MADLIVNGLVAPGTRRIDQVVVISEATRQRMADLQEVVLGTLDDALEALGTGDVDAATRVAESQPTSTISRVSPPNIWQIG